MERIAIDGVGRLEGVGVGVTDLLCVGMVVRVEVCSWLAIEGGGGADEVGVPTFRFCGPLSRDKFVSRFCMAGVCLTSGGASSKDPVVYISCQFLGSTCQLTPIVQFGM